MRQQLDDVTRFSCGDCFILARRIHHIAGWPMHCFASCYDEPSFHAFNVTPDGRAIDVTGDYAMSTFCKKWGCYKHRDFSRAEMRIWDTDEKTGEWLGPVFGKYSYQRARVVADRIVSEWKEKHGESS